MGVTHFDQKACHQAMRTNLCRSAMAGLAAYCKYPGSSNTTFQCRALRSLPKCTSASTDPSGAVTPGTGAISYPAVISES